MQLLREILSQRLKKYPDDQLTLFLFRLISTVTGSSEVAAATELITRQQLLEVLIQVIKDEGLELTDEAIIGKADFILNGLQRSCTWEGPDFPPEIEKIILTQKNCQAFKTHIRTYMPEFKWRDQGFGEKSFQRLKKAIKIIRE